MRKIKRIIGILSSIVMLLSIMPLTAAATDLPAPAHSKTVTSNEDGTYTLNLDVTGKVSSETVVKPADILLIVDVSGSMDRDIGSQTRLKKVQSLVGKLSDSILKKDSQNRMAMVAFSGSLYIPKRGEKNPDTPWNDASQVLNWTNSADTVKTSVNGLRANGKTNWEAGMITGAATMGNARADAVKYVVFLSDGNPTVHYNDEGITEGLGSSTSLKDVTEAVSAAKSLPRDVFYSVGIGGDVDQMKAFATSLGGTYKDGSSESALDSAFADLESMLVHNYKGVVISDQLSDYVEMINPSDLRVSAKKSDGSDVTIPEGAVTKYDSKTKTVTWTFPTDYVLETDATYTISFDVKPTQYAKDQYVELGQTYPAKGDTGTGANSSEKDGFYSNATAFVSYTKTDGATVSQESSPYAKPVIQVPIPPITELPNAGGTGIAWILMLGFGMIVFAGSLLIIQKKNFKKAEKQEM